MTENVITVEPSTTIVDAAKKMVESRHGPLPVVEGERLVGIITDRDLVARVVAEGRDPTGLTVNDIETRELVTIAPDADLEEAIVQMRKHQLDRLLVVEGERLVGIISEADLPGKDEVRPGGAP
ncbi:CBS domain-containing protein [Georgenia sp. AZ-5]|uniref:CBS domain-containing protein n=1 Tax=Georgenia sp. AZ-5 TaxID=3367526 RepID=UPI00375496E3